MKRLLGCLIFLCLVASPTPSRAQAPTTTTISDVVYRADGTPAGGTLLITWPAFATSSGKAVAAGQKSVTIGAGGVVSVALVPNQGATPSGTYYKVVYKLDDGSTSEELWSVPNVPTTTISAIRSTVVPAGVALQVASRQYVDTQLAAVTGTNFHNIRYCDQFVGPNAGVKIAACIADLPSTGGTADARGLEGAQTVNADFFSGVTKPVIVLLGAGDWTFNVGITMPAALSPDKTSKLVGGSDWRATTIKAGANGLTLVTLGAFTHLENLSLDGNAKTSVTAVKMSTSARVKDVNINAVNRGLYYEGSVAGAFGVFYSIANNVRITGSTNGIYMVTLGGPGTDWVNLNQCYSCQVRTSTGDAVYLDGASGNEFYGLDVEGNNFGLRLRDGQRNHVVGWFENNTTGNLYIKNVTTTAGTYVKAHGLDAYAAPFTGTSNITAATIALTVTAISYGGAADIVAGKIISVAGAGAAGGTLTAGVTAVSGSLPTLSVTLDTAAGTTVTGANTFGPIFSTPGSYFIGSEVRQRSFGGISNDGFLSGDTTLTRVPGTTAAFLTTESGLANFIIRDSAGNNRFLLNPATGAITPGTSAQDFGSTGARWDLFGAVADIGTSTTSPFYQGTAANQASAGLYRAASGEAFNFRNNANSADVNGLSKNPSDVVVVGGTAGILASSAELLGAAPLVLEGATDNGFETSLLVTDPTADRSVTIPNADSTTVQPDAGAANNFLTAISSLGVISKAQPSFSNLSGTATKAQQHAATVYNDQANTYSTGAKQTFQNSASTAGANFASSADPSTLAQGDLWLNTSALKWRGAAATLTAVDTTRTLTGGAGIGALGDLSADRIIATASAEVDFLADGNVTDLICGVSAQGKMQVLDDGQLQYCDGNSTSVLRRSAYGNASGESTAAAADSVALTTDTTGNYVASLSSGAGLTGFPAAGEGATGTPALSYSDTLAGDPAMNAEECRFSTDGTGGGLICEGTVADGFEGLVVLPFTASDKTITFFDATDTVVGRATTDTLTNKTLDAEAAGNALGTVGVIWIDGAGCNNTTALENWDSLATAQAVSTCNLGTNTAQGVLRFATDSGSLTKQRKFLLPFDWNSAGNVDALVKWKTAAIVNDVVWQIAIACVADGETDDPAFTDDVFTADTAKGVANQQNDTVVNTVTTTGTCAAGELAYVRIKRDPANAGDTLAAGTNADLIGLEIRYRRTQ